MPDGDDRLVHALGHHLKDGRPPLLGGRIALGPAQNSVIGADHARQNLRAAQVHADHGRSAPLPCHDERSDTFDDVRREVAPEGDS